MMTYHVAKALNDKVVYLVGYGENGEPLTGDREQALLYTRWSAAIWEKDDLNERSGTNEWFVAVFSDEAPI